MKKGSFTEIKQYLEVKKGSFTGLDLKSMMVWINVIIFYLKKWESKVKMKQSEKRKIKSTERKNWERLIEKRKQN